MKKLIRVIANERFAIITLSIPQDGERYEICLAASNDPVKDGWYISFNMGAGPVRGKRFNRTPGEWFRDNVVRRWRRFKIAVNPRPHYVWYSNYWMVDCVSTYGVKRCPSGIAYLKWFDREVRNQDENRFACQLIDEESYEASCLT